MDALPVCMCSAPPLTDLRIQFFLVISLRSFSLLVPSRCVSRFTMPQDKPVFFFFFLLKLKHFQPTYVSQFVLQLFPLTFYAIASALKFSSRSVWTHLCGLSVLCFKHTGRHWNHIMEVIVWTIEKESLRWQLLTCSHLLHKVSAIVRLKLQKIVLYSPLQFHHEASRNLLCLVTSESVSQPHCDMVARWHRKQLWGWLTSYWNHLQLTGQLARPLQS